MVGPTDPPSNMGLFLAYAFINGTIWILVNLVVWWSIPIALITGVLYGPLMGAYLTFRNRYASLSISNKRELHKYFYYNGYIKKEIDGKVVYDKNAPLTFFSRIYLDDERNHIVVHAPKSVIERIQELKF
jgi:hypothetical protein